MKHILIVDDDADMRGMIARWLSKEYRVTEAGSGEEALRLLEAGMCDLMLIDYVMPGMDGAETLKRVRDIYGAERPAAAFLSGDESLDIGSPRLAVLHPLAALSKAVGKRALLEGISDLF